MVNQTLLGLIVGVIGGILTINAINMYRATGNRHEYEPVEARVVESYLDTDSTGQSGSIASYMPRITYEYTVGGETYTNENLYPGPGTSGSSAEDEQQKIVDNFPEGKSVEAYYNPNEPSESFLKNESRNRQALGSGILGGGLLLFGVVLFIFTPL